MNNFKNIKSSHKPQVYINENHGISKKKNIKRYIKNVFKTDLQIYFS